MHPPDPDYIYVFYHVYRARSFGDAGVVLGRTRSAISESIAKLEAQVGGKLMIRLPGREPEPTALGAEFYRDTAGPIGDILEAGKQRARDGYGAELCIGTSHYILQEYIVPMMDSIEQHFPQARITYRAGTRQTLEAMLCSGTVHLAILTVDKPAAGIMYQELLPLPLVLLAPEALEIGNVEAFLAERAAGLSLACPPPEDAVTKHFFDLLKGWGIRLRVTHNADEISLVPWIVARGRAIGPCPGATSLVQRTGVRAWPLPCPGVTVGAFWCGKLSPIVQKLLEIVGLTARNLHAAAMQA